MKLCIVVNGPSAKNRGQEIDACDFVVRIKKYWKAGAENAGTKIDAWATRGNLDSYQEQRENVEHWYVLPCAFYVGRGQEKFKQEMLDINNRGRGRRILWATRADGKELEDYLRKSPSTAMVVIYMALRVLPVRELVLYGFDSTTPDRPRYNNARPSGDNTPNTLHDFVAEKRAVAEIFKGTWLGKPTAMTLTWPDMPDLK